MNLVTMIKSFTYHDDNQVKAQLRRERDQAHHAVEVARSRVLDELSKSVLSDLRRRPKST